MTSEKYMEEEKESSHHNPFSSCSREDRSFKKKNYENNEFNNHKDEHNHRSRSNWNNHDGDRRAGSRHHREFKNNYDYSDRVDKSQPKYEPRPPRREINDRQYDHQGGDRNFRAVNNPTEQVWSGPANLAADVKQPNRRFAGGPKRQNDAILDNVRTREDIKSIHMIFTKIKGQRYIDSIDKDAPDALDPKIGSKYP